MDPLQFNWAVPSHIKEEADTVQALLSPPQTPSSFSFSLSSPGLPPQASRPSPPPQATSGRVRPRPYPPSKPVPKKAPESSPQPLHEMQQPWSNSSSVRGGRPMPDTSRRLSVSDGERQASYSSTSMSGFMMNNSSLMGAIGEASDSQYPRVSFDSTMGWSTDVMTGNHETSSGVPGHPSLYHQALPNHSEYGSLDVTRHSPESLAPNSPSYFTTVPDSVYSMGAGPYRANSTSSNGSQSPYSRGDDPDREIRRLRNKVQELHQQLQQVTAMAGTSHSVPLNPAFRSGWKRRTEARKKQFCSLNRAGNALCAWHDSRRERRQYPPRNAPQGMLNCGCTHEEALFEESLSRHGVGGYLPGESVRMDPELRRPLLKLLKKRYGYKDGDFDYNPQTMEWYPDQDPESWERQAQSGSSARTRRPDHVDRH